MSIFGPSGEVLSNASPPVGGSSESRKLHSRDDVDFDRYAHHHTIGKGQFQVPSGKDFDDLLNGYNTLLTNFNTLRNKIIPYADFVPVISASAGAFAGGASAPTATMRWREIDGTIVWYATVVIGAASVGTASGVLAITLPAACGGIKSDQPNVGTGRESQSTGVALTVTRGGSLSLSILRYDNGSVIANSRQINISGEFERV